MTVQEVVALVEEIGCGEYVKVFEKEGINGKVLYLLDEEDLQAMGFERTKRKSLLKAIKKQALC